MKDGRLPPTVDSLVRTTAALWPGAAVEVARGVSATGRTPTRTREFVFVPHADRPRLLLPASAPAAAATAVRRYSSALRPAERAVRCAAALALRTGIADRLFRDRLRISLDEPAGGASIETELAEVFQQPVRVSLGLGNQRANQKPILQVLSLAGRSLAFVKVGHNEVARSLVQAEARALAQVHSLHLPSIRAPRVIAMRSWRGMDLLVLSALSTTPRRRRSGSRLPLRQMAELAAAPGLGARALTGSAYCAGLRGGLDELPDRRAARGLADVLDRVERAVGADPVPLGAWHGDWAPWNMSWERSGLLLWDWERFAVGVPVGFDALHYRLRTALPGCGALARAGELLLAESGELLPRLGVPVQLTRATTALYLLELSARYSRAASGPEGAPLRSFAAALVDFTTRRGALP